ncbi:MAG: acyl-CoA reductase, partial [Nitrospirota bacterium]
MNTVQEQPALLRSAIERLRAARNAAPPPSRGEIIQALAAAAKRWQNRSDSRRRQALDHLAAHSGLAPAMLDEGLDHQLADYTTETLARIYDEAAAQAGPGSRSPAVSLLIAAGNVPGLALPDVAAILLAGSACLIRPPARDPLTPGLFAETLIEVEPRMADLIAVASWPRDAAEITSAVAGAVDCVVASGGDETIDALALDAAHLIGFGHRWSAALIGAEALAGADAIADRLARDVCFYEQQGCLSPHVAYVEEGGTIDPPEFARRFAAALKRL